MILFLLAYLGGVLTIISPCILPVLPFVFAGANRSFLRGALPLLAGMAVTFAAVASLAAVGGGRGLRPAGNAEVLRFLPARLPSQARPPPMESEAGRRGGHGAARV